MKKRWKVITVVASTIAFTLIGAMWGPRENKPYVEAASKDSVKLRIIGTTDIHGQLNSKDYELGVDYNNGGLARMINLIKSTRNEMSKENVVTLDAGDTMFDYTTEYIFAEDQNFIQPIFQAMTKVGYDAITLGNHDFDYGYDYILKQLTATGLKDITVVSNVTDSKTGEYPFLENMLITRKMKTASGKTAEVKVGIIGQTIPTLTSKTHSYAGILKTEDMVENAKIQAAKLRKMGADIIIALSHTGIGPENPELNFKNVAYALTKIPDIDVVVCGHEHNLFPTTDMTSPYYKLPNVDKKTYLMNGKNVIMAGNRGGAIGVVDLTLEPFEDTYIISDRSSEIRFVKADTTKEDSAIASSYGEWEDKLLQYSTDVIAKLDAGTVIQNYYGMLGDNYAIQLLNDAKIDYAQRYVNTTGKKYADYPVIAASTYMSYGVDSYKDFINIHDSITESDLSAIQPYNNYLYIYTINGKQLKEWLEWSASAYETLYGNRKWKHEVMSAQMQKTGLKSLIREEWLDDWSTFYVFDGINYVIDPFTEPRYDISGNKISVNERITSITYNGKKVTDDMEFLLVTNKITKPMAANSGVDKQVVLNGFIRTQNVLSKYLKQISTGESILPQVDYNWKVNIPTNTQFIVKMPSYAHDLFTNTPWYVEYLTEVNSYRYYKASYQKETEDKRAPHLVVTPVITGATTNPFAVAVNASDESKIKRLCYEKGEFGVDYNGWLGAKSVNNTFTVDTNGIYSIYAEDENGNKTVYQLHITNFSDNMLGTPTVDTYTNRKTKISGRAEPNADIIFKAYTGTYTGKVKSDGTFSYPLPSQPSGTKVKVYVKDENGLESDAISVTVKRTGPNQPKVNSISNKDDVITGNTNDTDASILVIVGDKIYVSKNDGKALYEANTEIYDPNLEIIETKMEIDSTGNFKVHLHPLESGATATIYCIDHISRNSRAVTLPVEGKSPNAPIVNEVSNIEQTLTGVVPAAKKAYDMEVVIGSSKYNTKTDKSGNFTLKFTDQLHAGDKISVTAIDKSDGLSRSSYSTQVTVRNIEDYVDVKSTTLTINKVSNRSKYIIGNYEDTGSVYLAIAYGKGKTFKSQLIVLETDEFGYFEYKLPENLEVGTLIYAMSRFIDGNILEANKVEVQADKPNIPSLQNEIMNSDKTVHVLAMKDCEITLTIGKETYKSSEYVYDEENNRYIYTFTIDRAVSGTTVKVSASNSFGKSDVLTTKVGKAAPDRPKVNDIKAGDKKITGKIELFDYVAPNSDKKDEKIPNEFKDAATNVAKTQTKVYAQIGKKVYEGTIDNKGNFNIKIPAQKKGTVVYVWGSNKGGRGPLIKVTVK